MATVRTLYEIGKAANIDVLHALEFVGVNIREHHLIEDFLRRCGDFNTLYEDAETFRADLTSWTVTRSKSWNKLFDTTNFDYNPISNYDRTEEHSAQRSGQSVEDSSGNSKNVSLGQVSAYNSSDFQNKERNIVDGVGTGQRKSRSAMEYGEKVRAYGNIGVTTTQEMIEAERELWTFNLVETVCEEFKKEFAILVY